ncbi:MAG: HAD-IA family hydrolase, partial [Boseongicola sp.]|nr:HAD-IA family hydrolase [Boseongicola sp.]
EVGFYAWNAEQDRGRSRQEALAAAAEHAEMLDRIFVRFAETIQHKIDGTWDILNLLKASEHRVFGLTNWGAETWPVANDVHPELRDAFEDVVVSGQEKLIKPDVRIHEILTERNGLAPAECLFIDDSPKNVEGARNAGWDAVHFTNANALRADLVGRGIL